MLLQPDGLGTCHEDRGGLGVDVAQSPNQLPDQLQQQVWVKGHVPGRREAQHHATQTHAAGCVQLTSITQGMLQHLQACAECGTGVALMPGVFKWGAAVAQKAAQHPARPTRDAVGTTHSSAAGHVMGRMRVGPTRTAASGYL